MDPILASATAAVAVVVLTATSTGHLVVLAGLVGLACWDRWSGATSLLVALAVSLRFGTASVDALAGIQGVLGPAGLVGPRPAAVSAWAGAAALVLAARRSSARRAIGWLPVLACGVLAAAVVSGPRGEPMVQLGASVLAVAAAAACALVDRWSVTVRARRAVALAVGVAAVVAAGVPA